MKKILLLFISCIMLCACASTSEIQLNTLGFYYLETDSISRVSHFSDLKDLNTYIKENEDNYYQEYTAEDDSTIATFTLTKKQKENLKNDLETKLNEAITTLPKLDKEIVKIETEEDTLIIYMNPDVLKTSIHSNMLCLYDYMIVGCTWLDIHVLEDEDFKGTMKLINNNSGYIIEEEELSMDQTSTFKLTNQSINMSNAQDYEGKCICKAKYIGSMDSEEYTYDVFKAIDDYCFNKDDYIYFKHGTLPINVNINDVVSISFENEAVPDAVFDGLPQGVYFKEDTYTMKKTSN